MKPQTQSTVPSTDRAWTAPRPSEFYRQEHPDYFSDSESVDVVGLGEDELKFYLDQLTTERREREFEEFARAIAEKEICPNLLPQTGPVGGGDSKTDSSTFPVSEELGDRRYWGSQARPPNDDWAFAFSAQKTWKPKVAGDVTKITGLSRQFSKIFFLTNQPVPDKDREKWETKMRALSGRDVRILDRTWLVDRVFKGNHVEMAVAKLGLDVRMLHTKRLGPLDASREVELETLLNSLRNPDLARNDDYSLAESYLEAAKLASSLERPRTEVDGLFIQARHLAEKSRCPGLALRAHYQHAWRSYFWFDDPNETERIYEAMEPLLEQIGTGEECELFSNICSVLQTANLLRQHEIADEREDARVGRLRTRFTALAADATRPNTALFAKTLLVRLGMKNSLSDKQRMGEMLDAYLECFRQSKGLGTYPLLRFVDAIEGIGEFLCSLPNYNAYQNEVQQLIVERCGVRETGRRQLKYGIQLLTNKRYREAVTQLSKARFNLAHEETLLESGKASLALGAVYGDLELRWASRAAYLEAAHIALYSVESMRANPKRGFDCVMRLAWTELQLGRIAPFLAWRNFAHGLANQVKASGQRTEDVTEELERQDGCLGCLFLKLAPEQAAEFKRLPPTLDTMGLASSRIALLYSLGESSVIEAEQSASSAEIQDLVESWKKQPAYSQIRNSTVGETRPASLYEATIFGVKYRIRCANELGAQIYAETILGMLESAFADAKWEHFAFVVDTVDLSILSKAGGVNPPKIDPALLGMESQELVWGTGMIDWMRNKPQEYTQHLYGLLTDILLFTTIDSQNDIEEELAAWKAGGVFKRACSTGRTFTALLDLIGANKYDINNWIATPSS